MADYTKAQEKLIAFLKKKDPTLNEKEISGILNSFKRFVNLTRRIYTEPQAIISYKDRKTEKEIVKDRIITTDIEELKKVLSTEKQSETIIEVMRRFNKSVTNEEIKK